MVRWCGGWGRGGGVRVFVRCGGEVAFRRFFWVEEGVMGRTYHLFLRMSRRDEEAAEENEGLLSI